MQYFNAGMPQDAHGRRREHADDALHPPAGRRSPRGLGLTERQVDDLTDFLENALYDPAFVDLRPALDRRRHAQPNERDLTYSKYRPGLAALGAKDGVLLSGLAMDNNDPLSRRDRAWSSST